TLQTIRRFSETRTSITPGVQGNGASADPVLSADGLFVAFESLATNLVPGDTNGVADVFVATLTSLGAGTVPPVGLNDSGGQRLGTSFAAAISADGRLVAYVSEFVDLADFTMRRDVFVHDRQTGRNDRVTVNAAGVRANGHSQTPALSGDGRYVL